MKERMMSLVQEMVDNGYTLFNESVEQYVERMMAYGFTDETIACFHQKYMKSL